ncbi:MULTISPECIES: protein phosphatase CheZ [unclassified Vibrio]|uniref:Protein phosphatase CheZ n=1 Tax=Vibrio sp. HB236076 TaxID=3232307 RepID=A0AB39HKB1_9VIBR|nr:protein phosphatase CheZ [Vibrio sp. HB161653]MDP5254781.1 protein phosphatase CheZ [Vibrio sp. HB161653]
MISLEQAKSLVSFLEEGKQVEANQLLASLVKQSDESLLREVGLLTRQLHDSLQNFHLEDRLSEIAQDEMPDARERLNYVIEKTEVAANKTMDSVDECLPIADALHQGLLKVRPQWNELMHGRINLTEFKTLCHNIDDLLSQVEGNSSELKNQLTEILMAQDFQDLTGQIIRRVITLVNEVEGRLVDILTLFSGQGEEATAESQRPAEAKKIDKDAIKSEGPILHPELREDAVASQDEVDDLLSSLGF